MTENTSNAVHENLNTDYVNLAALLRYLQKRAFAGRVHIELVEYEADIYLSAHDAPRVRGINHGTGHQSEGDEAMQHLLAQSRDSGGLVSIYEGQVEAAEGAKMPLRVANEDIEIGLDKDEVISPNEHEWRELLRLSGELIAAVERASQSVSSDFESLFRGARLELSDDYPFLDPLTECFEYVSGGVLRFHARPGPDSFVASVCECLHRVVTKLARGERGGRFRERVALELAVLARRKQSQLTRFKLMPQFNRIAGTRVL